MGIRRNYFQTAWVVDDLETAMKRWLESSLVGPFFVVPHTQVEDPVYRGSPSELDMSVAMAQSGQMQIELIQQHSDGPSPYRDSVPAGTDAMHHVAAITDYFDADLEHYARIGVDLAFLGRFGDARFGYFDTRDSIGCMTELLERRPSLEGLFGMVASAGADWDGSDPIRRVG